MTPSSRIIGPPRSGTNYVKFLIDNNTKIDCGFNVQWWKHAVIPPIMDRTRKIDDETLSIIMVRDTVAQLNSFWNFCQKGRTAISSHADTFSNFLRQPIYMKPFDGIEYFFDSPLGYLAQFYYAADRYAGPKFFLNLEDVQACPGVLFDKLHASGLLSDPPSPDEFIRPSGYLGRNADKPLTDDGVYEALPTHGDPKTSAGDPTSTMDSQDKSLIVESQAYRIAETVRRKAVQ
ncbi:hypothetical protein [Shimia thalassica]|uniref:hypothetical protein n=1 Tax=Shimia thalassica TaxID=1715693 RepID=UPI00273331F1|nr:hypothetical protein [Shimia thalassica]MDP2520922.1 hypothetical protein [Shimia thalassica]